MYRFALEGMRATPGILALGVLIGCADRHAIVDGGPHDANIDGWRYDSGPVGSTDRVDILIVVDAERGGSTVDQSGQAMWVVGRLEQRLLITDQVADGGPVLSIHIGVITGDLGSAEVTDGWFCEPGLGDDGILARVLDPSRPDCLARYPSGIFDYDAPVVDRCIEDLDGLRRRGCLFQQELEATLLALSPAPRPDGTSSVTWTRDDYQPPQFADGRTGHAGPGGANEGFPRPDSVLVIVLVAPQDDCSTPDSHLFSMSEHIDQLDQAALWCHREPDPRYPIERYVEGFLGLRRSPSRLVVAGLVGVPPDYALDSYDQLLADPLMAETVEQPGVNAPAVVCADLLGEHAFAGRRVVSVLAGLDAAGAHAIVGSICEDYISPDLPPVVLRLFDAIQAARRGRAS